MMIGKDEMSETNRVISWSMIIGTILVALIVIYVAWNANCRLIIRNDTVIRMKEGIFQKEEEITEIRIPNGVKRIGISAFSGRCYLKKVEIPNSVEHIGENAFAGCRNLEDINLPEGIKSIEPRTFQACYSLEEINIPTSVLTIGASAFSLTYLREMDLPEGLVRIEENAFMYCTEIKEIVIPKSVTNIDFSAFFFTKWSESWTKDEQRCEYSDDILLRSYGEDEKFMDSEISKIVNQMLDERNDEEPLTINFNMKSNLNPTEEEITYVIRRFVNVKEGTRIIGISAFSDNSFVKKVDLPDSLFSIGDKAFENCTDLEELEIPQNVQVLGEDIFDNCISLKVVRIPQHLKESFSYTGVAEVIYY